MKGAVAFLLLGSVSAVPFNYNYFNNNGKLTFVDLNLTFIASNFTFIASYLTL